MGWGAFGDVFKKISQQFQTRIERLKNERDQLNAEKESLLNKHPITARDADRVYKIDIRIGQIKQILANSARD